MSVTLNYKSPDTDVHTNLEDAPVLYATLINVGHPEYNADCIKMYGTPARTHRASRARDAKCFDLIKRMKDSLGMRCQIVR